MSNEYALKCSHVYLGALTNFSKFLQCFSFYTDTNGNQCCEDSVQVWHKEIVSLVLAVIWLEMIIHFECNCSWDRKEGAKNTTQWEKMCTPSVPECSIRNTQFVDPDVLFTMRYPIFHNQNLWHSRHQSLTTMFNNGGQKCTPLHD